MNSLLQFNIITNCMSEDSVSDCCVCMDAPVNTVVGPCNHKVCDQCLNKLVVCPLCRGEIKHKHGCYTYCMAYPEIWCGPTIALMVMILSMLFVLWEDNFSIDVIHGIVLLWTMLFIIIVLYLIARVNIHNNQNLSQIRAEFV